MPAPVILLNNRAWIAPRAVNRALLNAFFYQTKSHVFDDEHEVWVDSTVDVDLVVDSKDGRYLGFPRGNLPKILRHMPSDTQVIDLRAVAPLGFTLDVQDHVAQDERSAEQLRLLAAWMEAGGGVIKAPAASGKSVIGISAVCTLGLRTLLLFDRKDFLKQWHREFYQHTNLAALEHIAGVKLAGQYRGGHEVWPITFATFQQLASRRTRQQLLRFRDYFGLVLVDECHHSAAPSARNALLNFNPLCFGGVTATPIRKDRLEGVYYDVLGPITVSGGAEQLKPLVWLCHTGQVVSTNRWVPDFAQWNVFLSQICRNKTRNQMIVDYVLKDLAKGRCVLVVSDRVAHCADLKKLMIRSGVSADRIALAVGATADRDRLYKDVNAGRYDVLLASKVIDEGINISRLDTLHFATPLAARARVEQRVGRIRRPAPNKARPLVYDYLDTGHGMMVGASRARQQVYRAINAEIRDGRTGLIVKVVAR